ncbi:hypothetical protein ACI3EY_17020 [Ornithinimicrobium sp. LYQ92]|uniref:hypothetical protein n=1 Tax=Serinicoccus sp. LYQ92 TaxID=3378798 RepID=UPI003853B583
MTSRRRPRGTAKNTHGLFARVDPAAAQLVAECAERLGVSNSEFVEAALLQVGHTLDSEGVPTWWTKQNRQCEELPLTG